MNPPDDEPITEADLDFNRELSERLIARLAKAGWITGLNINSQTVLKLQFTEKGMAGLGRIDRVSGAAADKVLAPHYRRPGPVRKAWLFVRTWVWTPRLMHAARELTPPSLDAEELKWLIAVAALKRQGKI